MLTDAERAGERMTTIPDESTWLSGTNAVAMQKMMRQRGVSPRRVQLLAVAAGDLIWDTMRPEARTAFVALRRAAERTATRAHRERLRRCGEVHQWLDWTLGIGKRTAELKAATAALAREIFGNPFRPVGFAPEWRTDTAVALAKQMYRSRDFSAMPILADALQDAGCNNDDVLNHCRDPKQVHVRGCWVVDLVICKEGGSSA
jgi:hypothetical protein